MTQLVDCHASDALQFPDYYRATWVEPWYVSDSYFSSRSQQLAQRIANDPDAFLVPLNLPTAVPGEKAIVMDLQTNARAISKTVADLTAALTPGFFELTVDYGSPDRVQHIGQSDATESARQQQKQQAETERASASVLTTLQHIGYVFIALLVVVGLYLALKAKKELAV